AYEQAYKATNDYIKSLEDEIAKIGLDEAALRALEINRQRDAAATDSQKAKINELNLARETALRLEKQRQEAEKANQDLDAYRKNTIAQLDIELQTMELVGHEREREILRLKHQAEMADINNRIKRPL